MNCPSHLLLAEFVDDAENTLIRVPWLADHVEHCVTCQLMLADLAGKQDKVFVQGMLLSPSMRGIELAGSSGEPAYRLEECLGNSSVYRARRLSDSRPVAVKLFQLLNPKQAKRVSLELQIGATASHPNIVKFLDSGSQDHLQYAVFEWIGGNLAQEMATGVLSIDRAVDSVIQVAEAVQYLHQLGFIHRDLKPQNVLVDESGTAKLADFGVARDLLDGVDPLTTQAAVIGTPSYMAPEQTGMINEAVSVRTDVYGLGALLYSLLAGQPPFKGNDKHSVLRQVVAADVAPLTRFRSDLPSSLEVICGKCLRKEPLERYASAEAVAEDLKRLSQGLPIAARRRPLPQRVSRWARRYRRRLSIFGACTAGLIFAVVLAGWQANRESDLRLRERADASLGVLLSCDSDRLRETYSRIESFPVKTMQRQLNRTIESTRTSLSLQVRLAASAPDQFFQRITPEQWKAGLQSMPLAEAIIVCERLQAGQCVPPAEHRNALLQDIEKANDHQDVLKLFQGLLVSRTDRLDKEPLSRLLQALRSVREEDIVACENAFELLADDMTALGLEMQLDAESDRPFLVLLGRWNQHKPAKLAEIVQRHTPHQLSWLKDLPTEVQSTLRQVILSKYEVSTNEGRSRLEPLYEDNALSVLASKYDGRLFRDFGYILDVPISQFDSLLNVINTTGWTLSSVQSRGGSDNDVRSVTVVLQRIPEPCVVNWKIPIATIGTTTQMRAVAGYQPKTFWLNSPDDGGCVDILFSSKGIHEAVFLPDKLNLFRETVQGDTSELHSQLERQAYRDVDLGTQASVSLLTRRRIAVRDESTRRVASVDASPMNNSGIYSHELALYVEQVGRGDAWAVATGENSTEHAQICEKMITAGYELQKILHADEGVEIVSYWRRISISLPLIQLQATRLVALWEMGDKEPLLAALKSTLDPSLRTELVQALSRLPTEAPHILRYLQANRLDADQVHQLILVLGRMSPEFFTSALRRDITELLTLMAAHEDSGVHYASRWALNSLGFTETPKTMLAPTQYRASTRLEEIPHRGWYYSESGIPFVVVRHHELLLLGNDPDVPWQHYSNQTVRRHDADFAISAIEIPHSIFSEYLAAYPPSDPERYIVDTADIALRETPVVSNSLMSYLRFCRWLTDREGIARTSNCLPKVEEIDFGLTLPSNFFELEGYRLPSQIEWEIAARAGSWTPAYFGFNLNLSPDFAWTAINTELRPMRGGQKPPSPWGLYDILGNVYEINLYRSPSLVHDHGTIDKAMGVDLRGGSFLANQRYASVDALNSIPANAHDSNAGIRIVRSVPPFKLKTVNASRGVGVAPSSVDASVP